MKIFVTEVKRRLTEQAGLDPDLLDRVWFECIVQDRLRELGLEDGLQYCRLLEQDRGELQRLVEHISVSETWFFRYPESFQLLVRHLQTLRTEDTPPRQLRMLSVACATGEEPYSMAIAAVQAGWSPEQLVLDAVDRNKQDIHFARLATYRHRALRNDAPDWATSWFHDDGQHLHVAPEVVGAVHWIVADVLRAPSSAFQDHYDVIFCRNLLIYLHDSARQHLIERLAGWLTDRGLLFVGHAERAESMRSRFQFTATPHAFALRTLPPQSTVSQGWDKPCRPEQAASGDDVPALVLGLPRAASLSPPGYSPHEMDARTAPPVFLPILSEARRLADAGHLAEALRAVQTIIADQEPNAIAYTLLGSVHLALGNLAPAREAFLKSVYLDPRCEDTLLQLALVYDRQGNQRLAARYRHRAAEVHRSTASEES